MRKYYQAALAVTATVSLISLLFYRHEYNKLRYVLEVFNYFGKPNDRLETNCTNHVAFTNANEQFDEPLSSWQRLDDDLFVYSAYSIRQKEIQVVAVGSPESFRDIQCMVYFENEVRPILGKFEHNAINDNSNVLNNAKSSKYRAYRFYCLYETNNVAVGITFLSNSNKNIDKTPILPVSNQPQSLNSSNIALCVMPSFKKPVPESEMISFLNFHYIIGMNNFIVYDFGIPNHFNRRLKRLAMTQSPYWKFTYTQILWNFPFHEMNHTMIKDIIEADCLYRTYNKAMYVAALSWEQYIVLKYHRFVADLIEDFQRSRMNAGRYKLEGLAFCLEQPDNTRIFNATSVILRKTRFDPNVLEDRFVHIYKPHETMKSVNVYTRNIGINLAALNEYKYCNRQAHDKAEVYDSSVLRFAEDMQNSPIYKELMP